MTALTAFLQRNLGRVTSSGEYIPQIDGLRFLALLLIFSHHVFAAYLVHTHRFGVQSLPRDWGLIYSRSPLISWALNLAIGIPLFCTISGFVLAIPFARKYFKGAPPPSRKLYLLRRLIRMEPPYIIAMAFLFLAIVFPWGRSAPFSSNDYLFAFFPHFLASLGYVHALVYGEPSWINGVAWTLEIEVQFYLVLPLLAEIFRIRQTRWRRSLMITLILSSAVLAESFVGIPGSSRLSLSLAVQFHFFLGGLLLADLYLLPPRTRISPHAGDLLALTSAVLLVFVLHFKPRLAWTEPFLIVTLYYGVFAGGWTGRLFRLPLVTAFGGMCYSTYLYHVFLVDRLLPLTVRFFPPNHSLLWDSCAQILLLALPVLGICTVIYAVAERPFMVLSHRVARRSPAPPPRDPAFAGMISRSQARMR